MTSKINQEHSRSILKIAFHNDKTEALLMGMKIDQINNKQMKEELTLLLSATERFSKYISAILGESSEVFGEMYDKLDENLDKMIDEVIN